MRTDNIVSELHNLPVATLGDMLKSLTILDPEIRPLVPGTKIAGPAFTVKCYPGSIITVHKALYEVPPGHVLVIDGEADIRGALMGEVMARAALAKGVTGVVVDGAVRDIGGIRKLGLPVFARAINPRVGTNRRIGLTNSTISCGGIVVSPGDYIAADDEGIVMVPAKDAEKVIQMAKEDLVVEEDIMADIEAGKPLLDILGLRETVYPETEKHKGGK